MELRYPISARYVLVAAFGIIFSTLSYLIHVYEPTKVLISELTQFTPNSIIFNLWKTPPVEVLVKIYMFNVTNPEQFLNGEEKIRLQEVGPYSYREIMYNTNTTFNSNGTLTFIPKRKLEFSLKDSIGDASIDKFILPNIALLGITSYLHDSSIFTNLAFKSLASYLGAQPFVNLTVNEYLLGYDDKLVTLANSVIPNWIDFAQLGILDRVMALDNSSELVTMNIKSESDYSVLTNKRDIMPFAITRWANTPGLPLWGYIDDETGKHPENTKCNTVEGALTGILFPRDMNLNQTVRLYRRAFCRPLPFHYYKSGVSKDGFDVNIFTTDPAFLSRKEYNSENSCYCSKSNPEDCLPNGVGDLSPCYYGIPVAISQPHFLNADPSVLENIDGLFPNEEKHKLYLSVYPNLGIPLEAHLRIQINIVIPDTKYNSKVVPFNNLVLPLFWADVTMEKIPSQIKFYITLFYYILPVVEPIIMYLFAIIGVSLLFYASILIVFAFTKQVDNSVFNFKYSSLPLISIKQKDLPLHTHA